jgi:VanZ family protein
MNYSFLRYGAAILWTIIILIGCTIPGPKIEPVVTLNDKFMHIAIFVGFAVLWVLAGRRPVWVLVAGLLYGILIEVIQGVLPINRSADVDDAVADFIGTLLGVGLALGLQKIIKLKP